jgi:PAS domain S-box-containing protein
LFQLPFPDTRPSDAWSADSRSKRSSTSVVGVTKPPARHVGSERSRCDVVSMPGEVVARHHAVEGHPGGRMGADGDAQPRMVALSLAPRVLLEAIIDMSDDAIFTCDLQGCITTWGGSAERLFGRAEAAVRDGPLEALFPRHFSRDVRSVVATALAGDRISHFETEVVRPDGMPLPVSLSMRTFSEGDGAPLGLVVIARDVTEQRVAQAALAEVDARMEEGEALAHIGSWLWDVRTGAVQWSAEFHRIHEIDPLDFDGTFESYLELIHVEDRDRMRTAMMDSVESGRQFNGEYRVIGSDHEVRLVQVRAQPTFGSTGKAVGLRGIGQDVTVQIGSRVTSDPPGS